ncbi:hypothetical protein BVRB_9g224490 [Beta vulgaris subsp. vulgaris]|uniref:Uncharacterized protein n=1 Tax=Beta vulgaris subsp. vulgaris TaxID=3555 RepID=A0A0J8B967_BETVV|nr:hypothetical protein BVRB_9g224490 [Beta vulgaris subsp. vulgaris]
MRGKDNVANANWDSLVAFYFRVSLRNTSSLQGMVRPPIG